MANSRIGAEQLTLAELLTDVDGGSTTYDTPFAITKRLIMVNITHESSLEKQAADDETVDIYSEDGDITIEIDVTDFTEDELATIFGNTMAAGIRSPGPSDTHPYFAVSWKSKKRNGAYKYFKLLKVMFKEPDSEHSTKNGPAAPQTDKISGIGIQRLSDGLRKRVADSEATSYVASTGTGWFTTGDISPDTTPPTVDTVVPADAATEQLATVNVVWTFDEAILPTLVTDNPDETNPYFQLIKASDGTIVAGALTIGTNDTVVTFSPTENLAAGGAYIAIANTGICDKSGNHLAATSITNFAVAS